MKPYGLGRLFLMLCFSLLFLNAISQVEYDDLSLNEALTKANAEGKLVFVQLASPSCKECNAVAEKGLSDKELSQLINQTFVSLYVDENHPDRRKIEASYNLPGSFGTLFINSEGTLIHKYAGSSTRPQQYREQIDIALVRAGEGLKVSDLEKEYRNGNRTFGLLESLLLKKKSLNLNNKELLDEYVSLLPADSFSSLRTLQFIITIGPELRSNAYKTLLRDTAVFNRAWHTMSSGSRAASNFAILRNSLNRAVQEKNEPYAFQVASFARSRYQRGSVSGIKAFSDQLLEYYKRTNDTLKFLVIAAKHYDLIMTTTNRDSLKQADIALQKKTLDTARKMVTKTEYGYSVRTTIRYNPLAQRFHWELKEGAWHVYKRTSDTALLAKATVWIETALKVLVTPEALDVYARLLYKQHQNEKALETESKAIALRKKAGFTTTEFELTLQQMQKGLAVTD